MLKITFIRQTQRELLTEIFSAFVDRPKDFVKKRAPKPWTKEQSMPKLYGNVLANLTADENAFSETCTTLNERMRLMAEDDANNIFLEMDLETCNAVFEAVFDASENLTNSVFKDGWLEVSLKYLALFDETNYSAATGVRMLKMREQLVPRLVSRLHWPYHHRNWQRLMAVAADLLLAAPHKRSKDLEIAIAEAAVKRDRMSDRRTAVSPEELHA